MAEKKSKGTGLKPIELLYRPVFDTHLNMAIDYETAVRINDKTLGVMEGERFLPIAEKSGQIVGIEKWALEEACDAMIRCAKREADINMVILQTSIRHISRKTFAPQMMKIVEKTELEPERFCFNISGSILESHKEVINENIKTLRKNKFLVSIDDFGVEYTSLSRLSQYEVDYIGINETLLTDFVESEKVQNTVQGIIEFAKKIETLSRVSGVDDENKAKLLRAMGADQMKGSFYGGYANERKIK